MLRVAVVAIQCSTESRAANNWAVGCLRVHGNDQAVMETVVRKYSTEHYSASPYGPITRSRAPRQAAEDGRAHPPAIDVGTKLSEASHILSADIWPRIGWLN